MIGLWRSLQRKSSKMMAQKDPIAAAARNTNRSNLLFLELLEVLLIDAFLGDGKLFDTPGVHLHHRQAAVIPSEDLPALAPRSRLRGHSFPLNPGQTTQNKIKVNDRNGYSLFWGGLVRVDVLKVPPSTF